MNESIDGWMNGWMYGLLDELLNKWWMDELIDGWINRRIGGSIDGQLMNWWIDGWMNRWMYQLINWKILENTNDIIQSRWWWEHFWLVSLKEALYKFPTRMNEWMDPAMDESLHLSMNWSMDGWVVYSFSYCHFCNNSLHCSRPSWSRKWKSFSAHQRKTYIGRWTDR